MPTTLRLPFLALALLTALSTRADDHPFSEKFERTAAFKPDGEIKLSNINGAVTIRTWDRAEIKIEGEKRAKTDEELKLIAVHLDLSETALTLKTEFSKRRGGFLFFGGESVRGHVQLTLTVPATAKLADIATVNGSLTLDGTRGPVRAHSVNGRVTATRLGGDASLETVNGSLGVEFAAVTRGQKISAKTVNGTATLAFPKDATFTFNGRSVNGSINCDFPITNPGSKTRGSLVGTVGTVGEAAAALEVRTVNGSIRVKQL